jgi:biopolymer transport protein ExbD
MSDTRRAKRMSRHHARKKFTATLNMVSLMDIFTILVFFLLVSSSSVKDLPSAKQIKLPESISEQAPKEAQVIIIVSEKDIVVGGRKIASVAAVQAGKKMEIQALKSELLRLAKRTPVKLGPDGKALPREVTIMGDQKIPFALLKKIMLTCTKANYTNISLAVLRKRDKG